MKIFIAKLSPPLSGESNIGHLACSLRFPQSRLHLSIVQASLTLHSVCTTFHYSLFTIHSDCKSVCHHNGTYAQNRCEFYSTLNGGKVAPERRDHRT